MSVSNNVCGSCGSRGVASIFSIPSDIWQMHIIPYLEHTSLITHYVFYWTSKKIQTMAYGNREPQLHGFLALTAMVAKGEFWAVQKYSYERLRFWSRTDSHLVACAVDSGNVKLLAYLLGSGCRKSQGAYLNAIDAKNVPMLQLLMPGVQIEPFLKDVYDLQQPDRFQFIATTIQKVENGFRK